MIMNKTIFTQIRLRNRTALPERHHTCWREVDQVVHVAAEQTGSKVPHGLWDDAVPNALSHWPLLASGRERPVCRDGRKGGPSNGRRRYARTSLRIPVATTWSKAR